jgi:hypothetical protein
MYFWAAKANPFAVNHLWISQNAFFAGRMVGTIVK